MNRFATFAQAIRNTIPTVAKTIHSGRPTLPATTSSSGLYHRTVLLDEPRVAGGSAEALGQTLCHRRQLRRQVCYLDARLRASNQLETEAARRNPLLVGD